MYHFDIVSTYIDGYFLLKFLVICKHVTIVIPVSLTEHVYQAPLLSDSHHHHMVCSRELLDNDSESGTSARHSVAESPHRLSSTESPTQRHSVAGSPTQRHSVAESPTQRHSVAGSSWNNMGGGAGSSYLQASSSPDAMRVTR